MRIVKKEDDIIYLTLGDINLHYKKSEFEALEKFLKNKAIEWNSMYASMKKVEDLTEEDLKSISKTE